MALPLGGTVGFYAVMLLPKLAAIYPKLDSNLAAYLPKLDPGGDGYGIFKFALWVGGVVAFTACLMALTLPWRRRRKRRGRALRIALSCVLVVVASAGFADVVHALIYDLVFAAWLAYVMAYTFVRYGVLDQTRREAVSTAEY
jgi:hypothetical protein